MAHFFSLLDSDDFFKKCWGKSHYKFKTEFNTPSHEAIINAVLASDIQYPEFRIVQRGGSITPYLYTDSNNNSLSNKINLAKFEKLDLTGKTIKISGLERYVKEVNCLSNDVGDFFKNSTISINGYFSTGNAQGGSPHYDFYHIFAFQISGEKKWKIGEIVEENPHKDFGHQLVEKVGFVDEITTCPGDVLYLPPGLWHDVSTDTGSVHFAIGVQTPRMFNLLNQAILDISKNSSLFRSDIPQEYLNGIVETGLSDSKINELLDVLKKHLQESNGVEFLRRK